MRPSYASLHLCTILCGATLALGAVHSFWWMFVFMILAIVNNVFYKACLQYEQNVIMRLYAARQLGQASQDLLAGISIHNERVPADRQGDLIRGPVVEVFTRAVRGWRVLDGNPL